MELLSGEYIKNPLMIYQQRLKQWIDSVDAVTDTFSVILSYLSNSYAFIQEKIFQNVVSEMSAILFRPQFVKQCYI